MNTVEEEKETKEAKNYSIVVNDLTFAYPGLRVVLNHLSLHLENGCRCLLIGANGSGKSTILRILAGRHLTKPENTVVILGRDAFHDTTLNFERAYLDTEWGMRSVSFAGYGCPLQADIPVSGMMTKLQEQYPERRAELLKLLDIDPSWRMHQVSEGQRRRVQIFIGLLRPFKVLLLDEVTVSLDVIVRQDLLLWLKHESQTRGATILYATHIFDGLDDWPSHLLYLTNKGNTGWHGRIEDLEEYQKLRQQGEPSPILRIAEKWLRAELNERRKLSEYESAQGEVALKEKDPLQSSTNRAGGYASGRMSAYL